MYRSWPRPLGTFDLLYWSLVLCISLAAAVQAVHDGDEWRLLLAVLLLVTSGVWLVRTRSARRGRRRQVDHQPSS